MGDSPGGNTLNDPITTTIAAPLEDIGSEEELLDVRAIPVKTEEANGGACHNPCNIDR
jgi:hypothetical protein